MVLAPGVGQSVPRPFGSFRGYWLEAWNAFHPSHLPLPRSVGPYAVVRTSNVFSTNAECVLIGPAQMPTGEWTSSIIRSSVISANPVNGAGNCDVLNLPIPGVAVGQISTFTCVPAAMSVQIMNTEPLQTTSGLVAAACCPTQLNLKDNTRTWDAVTSQMYSYMKPRLMSAPKLALRGVHINSYPLDMNALSNFTGMENQPGGAVTWDTSSADPTGTANMSGLAPIYVSNNSGHELQYLVAVEWRVRFDLANPAVSSHVHHGVTPDSVWNKMVKAASDLGHGVKDIADVVATTGEAVSTVTKGMKGLGLV